MGAHGSYKSSSKLSLAVAWLVSADVIYRIGYLYRYRHFYTGERSVQIYKQAPVDTMKRNYMMFHTMDPTLAIEDLKEIYGQN